MSSCALRMPPDEDAADFRGTGFSGDTVSMAGCAQCIPDTAVPRTSARRIPRRCM